MNHLFSKYSWGDYFTLITILTVIYYLYIIIRHYRAGFRAIRNKPTQLATDEPLIPEVLRYQDPMTEDTRTAPVAVQDDQPDNLPDSGIDDADELISRIKNVIMAAAGRAYAPKQLETELKNLLQAPPRLTNSPFRPSITEMIVTECERTGTALLTEDEVDEWWK